MLYYYLWGASSALPLGCLLFVSIFFSFLIKKIFTDKGDAGGAKNELPSNSYEVAEDGK